MLHLTSPQGKKPNVCDVPSTMSTKSRISSPCLLCRVRSTEDLARFPQALLSPMPWIPSPTSAQAQSRTMTQAPAGIYILFAGKSSAPKVSLCLQPSNLHHRSPLPAPAPGPTLQCLLAFTPLTHALTREQCYLHVFSLFIPVSHCEAEPCVQLRCEGDAHRRPMLVSEESCERGRSPGQAPFVLRSVESY